MARCQESALSGGGDRPPHPLCTFDSHDILVLQGVRYSPSARERSMTASDDACSVQNRRGEDSSPACMFHERGWWRVELDGEGCPLASPFAERHGSSGDSAAAYDDLVYFTLWIGIGETPCSEGTAGGLLLAAAAKHGVAVRPDAGFSAVAAWRWLRAVLHWAGDDAIALVARRGAAGDAYARTVAGALGWLRRRRRSAVSRCPTLKAGDWPVCDICAKWPEDIARELAGFVWPLICVSDVTALLTATHSSPKAIVGCEFTAAVRGAYERHFGHTRVALSVDLRVSLTPGPHARMVLQDVLPLKAWDDAILHPPCRHQVLSDTTAARAKQLDGRSFWGIAFFIYCWCTTARRLVVEQPPTIIPDFYLHPSQRLRPCDVGDPDSKPIELYERGRVPIARLGQPVPAESGHKRLRDFEDAEARDRWRSSWLRFPHLCAGLVAAGDAMLDQAPNGPVYGVEIEAFAAAWYDAGLPVPHDYNAADAQPVDPETRRYQSTRGVGDGRRIRGVIPTQRRGHGVLVVSSRPGDCRAAYRR
jgi:hypothetical protein